MLGSSIYYMNSFSSRQFFGHSIPYIHLGIPILPNNDIILTENRAIVKKALNYSAFCLCCLHWPETGRMTYVTDHITFMQQLISVSPFAEYQKDSGNMSDIDLKHCDLLDFSKMSAAEYNMPELSDRVLVFDVMQDEWESASILSNFLPKSEPNAETLASTSTCGDDSSENQPFKNAEELDEVKNENPVERDEAEPGSQSEKESDRMPEVACEQDKSTTLEIDSSSTSDPSECDTTKVESPNQKFNEPLRQHQIHVHSFWLSIQSPYFRSLFYSSGMKENQNKVIHIKVPESEENAHLILLEAVYRADVLNDKTVDELLAVLELTNKYNLKFVFKKCKYVLQKNATTFEASTRIMHVIKVKHNMDDVEDLAATLQLVLAQEFSPLDLSWEDEEFTSLSKPSLKYLLSSDELSVVSENTVFHALMYWMEENGVDPAELVEEANDLLAVVRFKLVTIDYLYNVINNHPIASKMPKFNELYIAGMTYHAIPEEQKELLERQPVLRRKPEETVFQHVFVLQEQDLDVVRQNGAYKCPDKFWACGYEMSMDVTCDSSFFRLQLSVHNLKKESLVHLNFGFTISKRNITWNGHKFRSTSSSIIFSQGVSKKSTAFNMNAAIVPLQ